MAYPISQNDIGSFVVPDTGYLNQRIRLTLSGTEHAVVAGSGRAALADPDPFFQGTFAPQAFSLTPDEYVMQYKQLRLRGKMTITLGGNANIILTDLMAGSRLTLAGRGF
jgi:hypothetical protein